MSESDSRAIFSRNLRLLDEYRRCRYPGEPLSPAVLSGPSGAPRDYSPGAGIDENRNSADQLTVPREALR